MASTIGIKIANGEFYSILDENLQVKKRMVLTTAHNNQQSVQIDLYKSYTRTMADALYMGTLVVEKIKPRPKGEPSIELIITSSKNGNITADAVDLDASHKGIHQTLNVSLKSLEEDNRDYEIPDFELEQNTPPPSGLYEKASGIKADDEKQRFPWLAVICIILVITAIALAIWFFLIRGITIDIPIPRFRTTTEATQIPPAPQPSAPPPAAPVPQTSTPPPAAPPVASAPPPAAPVPQTSAPPPSAAQATPVPQAPSVPQATPVPQAPVPVQPAAPPPAPVSQPVTPAPPPVIQAPTAPSQRAAPVNRTRPVPPVASYRVPSVIPREGVQYRIRYGDTLWDIAEAFYRNPWLYPRIARFNNIRNPDFIISGTTIRVPPRN